MASGSETSAPANVAPEENETSLKRPLEGKEGNTPTAKTAKAQPPPSAKGVRVRIVNLKAVDAEYNRREGILEEFNGRSWRVILDGDEAVRSRPHNLELLPLTSAMERASPTQILSKATLEAESPAVQKQLLCEVLFPAVARCELEGAARITLILLEMESAALLSLLESDERILEAKVREINATGVLNKIMAPMHTSENTSHFDVRPATTEMVPPGTTEMAGPGTTENSICSDFARRTQGVPTSTGSSWLKVDWKTCVVASLERVLSEEKDTYIPLNTLFKAALYARRDGAAFDVLQFLVVEKGLNVNIQSKQSLNQSPLFYAARYARTSVIHLLLSNQAEVNAKDSNDETPLFYASRYNSAKVVDYLLQEGAKKNLQSRLETGLNTPLIYASKYKAANLFTLLSYRADPNIGDAHGRTPLHYCKDVQAVKALVAAGARANVRDENGDTALSLHHRVDSPEEAEIDIQLTQALLKITAIPEQTEFIMQFAR